MDRSETLIATMTWARDGQEAGLLREAMQCLAEQNIPAVITDGGSGKEFVDYLSSFPGWKVFAAGRPGVFAQIKRSLKAAYHQGARFVLYTEPDKTQFFQNGLRRFISRAPSDERVGVVLASRSAASFATFPELQRYTEAVINRLCAEVIGEDADYSYGPLLINRALLPYLDAVEDDVGWGWRHFIFGMAHRLGHRVVHLVDDLPCPPDQREEGPQERIHRMRQLSQNIQGLVLSTTTAVARA